MSTVRNDAGGLLLASLSLRRTHLGLPEPHVIAYLIVIRPFGRVFCIKILPLGCGAGNC